MNVNWLKNSKSWRWLMPLLLLLVSISPSYAAKEQTLFKTKITDLNNDSKRPLVFIYYANETSPTIEESQNFKSILNLLDSVDQGVEKKVAQDTKKSIVKDLNTFGKTVANEVGDIKTALAKNLDSKINVVIFTNSMARQGFFEVAKAGKTFVKVEFPKIKNSHKWDYISSSNILSNIESFKASLQSVAEIFPPQSHDFALVTKSHGDSEKIVRPKLIFDSTQLDQAKFNALVFNEATRDKLMHISGVKNQTLLAKNNLGDRDMGDRDMGARDMGARDLGARDLGARDLGEEVWFKKFETQLNSVNYGIDKHDYLAAIKEAGKSKNMNFKLVFAESCKSDLGKHLPSHNLSNVGLIITSKEDGLPYSNLKYSNLFEKQNLTSSSNFLKSLESALNI